jgi:DNA-binding NarL/FixJ family response regulator
MQTNHETGVADARRMSGRAGATGFTGTTYSLVSAPGVATPGTRWAVPREAHLVGSPRSREGMDRQITLALRADDPITADGAAAYFQSAPHPIRVLPSHLQDQSDVLLIVVGKVTDETLSWMRRAAVTGRSQRARVVLVAESMTESQLMRAINYGLTSFLYRHQVGFAQVLRAVVNSREGRAELPDTVVASLVEQLRTAQQAQGGAVGTGGLTPRETEVLRHLADGLDTLEIASQLSYSERTIKNIIHGLITRFGLRNRAHAVAHGIRTGLI